jgi:hypothetical protein
MQACKTIIVEYSRTEKKTTARAHQKNKVPVPGHSRSNMQTPFNLTEDMTDMLTESIGQ